MSNPAETYEQFLVPAVFQPWAIELLTRAGLQEGERVLDAGCGTGIVSRTAASMIGRSGKVTGVDLNPQMLLVASSSALSPDSASIEWLEGMAGALPVPDSAYDLVTIQQVLQFVPDRVAALREAHRVLVPGGRIALSVFSSAELHPAHQAMDQVLALHLGQPPLVAGFALWDAGEIRSLLEQAGLTVSSLELVTKQSRYVSPELFARPFIESVSVGIVSFRQLDGAARGELIAKIVPDLIDVIKELTVDGVVEFPWHSHIAIAST